LERKKIRSETLKVEKHLRAYTCQVGILCQNTYKTVKLVPKHLFLCQNAYKTLFFRFLTYDFMRAMRSVIKVFTANCISSGKKDSCRVSGKNFSSESVMR
jgi:hypothetical protein